MSSSHHSKEERVVTVELHPSLYYHGNASEAMDFMAEHLEGKVDCKLTFGMGEDARAAALCENLMTAGYVVEQKELVPPSTLRAFVQERLESGLPLPDSITVFSIRKTIVKSSKGKI